MGRRKVDLILEVRKRRQRGGEEGWRGRRGGKENEKLGNEGGEVGEERRAGGSLMRGGGGESVEEWRRCGRGEMENTKRTSGGEVEKHMSAGLIEERKRRGGVDV